MRVSAPRTVKRVFPLAGALIAAAASLMLLGAAGARAAELVYFENDAAQNQIAVLDAGSGVASLLETSGAAIDAPQGITYDPVANRLYVTSVGLNGDGDIGYVNLDGDGGGTFPLPPGTPAIKNPRGAVVDPLRKIIYWLNNTDSITEETISWARLDGSEGGNLDLGGQPLLEAERLTVDPAGGRLFWGNSDGSIRYVPLVDSLGTAGKLDVSGGGTTFFGISLDLAGGRLFWVEFGSDAVWTAGLTGTDKSEAVPGSAAADQPIGLAFDPDQNRLLWANFGKEDANGALGTATLGSPASAISPAGVAVSLPQDPLVIKSPSSGTGPAPQVTLANGRLQCSQGSWRPDYVSSFVYQSPRSFAYSWTLGGNVIAGATEASYAPPTSGSYACVVTATNQAGSANQVSAGLAVKVTTNSRGGRTVTRQEPQRSKPADLQLLGKARHLRARPGKLLTLKVRTTNEGTVASNPANLCLKLTKGAKRALRAGKCQRLGVLRGGATDVAKLRLRVKRAADPGLYRLRIAVPGSQTKVTVRVLG